MVPVLITLFPGLRIPTILESWGKREGGIGLGIGRNETCPCGSGKKFKKCCLVKGGQGTNDPLGDLKSQLQDREYGSLEEAQAFIGQKIAERQVTGLDDFCGLNPDQVHRILSKPFESPMIAKFPSLLANEPAGPIVRMAEQMFAVMGTEKMRPTAEGKLPRKLRSALAEGFLGSEIYKAKGYDQLAIEEDHFPVLALFRWIMHFAGFLEVKKTVLRLTPEFHELRQRSGYREIYPRLFRAYSDDLDWADDPEEPDYPMLQRSMLFHLFLFKRLGSKWRDVEDYYSSFHKAFPQIVSVEGGSEEQLADAYLNRVVFGWNILFGIMEFNAEEQIRATPFLDDLVIFSPQIQKLFQ